MNIERMIDVALRNLSIKHTIFLMERRTYKDNKVYKSYILSIDGEQEEYRNKYDLFFAIKEMI